VQLTLPAVAAMVPEGQAVQTPAVDVKPGLHCAQAPKPTTLVNNPGAQKKQLAAPTVAAYVPSAQVVQLQT
jgi:hypothetical protein